MFLKEIILLWLGINNIHAHPNHPVVINTWAFVNSSIGAWNVLEKGGSSLDAIEIGGGVCESQQCDGTVGYGGSPDEDGETTLDALLMNGKTMKVGAVGSLRRVKNAISVARHVLEYTKHSILVGDLATKFAVQMGFKEESLTTQQSKNIWMKWRNENNCQPNFWMDVIPDAKQFCGPYQPKERSHQKSNTIKGDRFNHDTIGLVAIDKNGDIAAGTTTNGAKYKIPGRIGDSPIPGSGAYADNEVGGAAATGDGDVMLRFVPSFLAVEEMRRGATPTEAATIAIKRIAKYYPNYMGAVVALRKDGEYGAACHGLGDKPFPFVVRDTSMDKSKMVFIECP
ncbi:unnamed protein product [Pieris macdunnoughi]|uniref:N(4)-(beta-N-acetylglucosaminyl)-L-asparaginase n=1 Tax=Pieris macdunnoughi TaxID=345717 RepID=A0A821UT55_9NEOP|nr:unnamed protein product [Pieris macdunnoughi]